MRSAGVLAVSNPLPRVYVRHIWFQTGAGVTGSACAAVLLVGQARHQHHHEDARVQAQLGGCAPIYT